jgi:hypothetical protein
MEHIKERWKVARGVNGLEIESAKGYAVAEAIECLPEDADGSRTLQHICDLHNASLAKPATASGDLRERLICAALAGCAVDVNTAAKDGALAAIEYADAVLARLAKEGAR